MTNTLRMFFAMIASLILLGIIFTGFTSASFILYIPVIGLGYAAYSGNCPGLKIADILLDKLGPYLPASILDTKTDTDAK